jgi:hypothetical protein
MQVVLPCEVFFRLLIGQNHFRIVRFTDLAMSVQLVNVHLVHTQGACSGASHRWVVVHVGSVGISHRVLRKDRGGRGPMSLYIFADVIIRDHHMRFANCPDA